VVVKSSGKEMVGSKIVIDKELKKLPSVTQTSAQFPRIKDSTMSSAFGPISGM